MMGGFGSERPCGSGRGKVEDCRSIDVNRLIEGGPPRALGGNGWPALVVHVTSTARLGPVFVHADGSGGRLSLNRSEPAKKSGQNNPKNRCRTTIAERIVETEGCAPAAIPVSSI
jgi:hypothetical protein